MAMLAEPRRKQKVINLRAKNNAWSNDNTKFGQRMLEKMGWSSGKGLGAHENGITEHVIARYKNDEKGLGFEDKNDQWTKHEDDFNALLANLSNANDNTENVHSGISLEDKSKKSKARIHYHKFTRGKDISRYSEKDLANIFGKKSFKNTEEKQVPLKEESKAIDQVLFTEKGSMEDYFKNKLAEFRSKSKLKISNITENVEECDELSYGFQGFSQETDNREFCGGIGYNHGDKNNSENYNVDYFECDSESLKKTSKTHENFDLYGNDVYSANNTQNDKQCIYQNQESIKQKNKKKKSKSKASHVDNNEELYQNLECIKEKSKKRLSKKKLILANEGDSLILANDSHDIYSQSISVKDLIIKKKKKSKKEATINSSENIQMNNSNETEVDLAQSQNKKKKKSKNKTQCQENIVLDKISKKKAYKKINYENVEDIAQNNTNEESEPKKKKKKKHGK